jgi:HAD superfamily hydrolase (TIGR01509 family)
MNKVLLFDFSRVLLFAKDKTYTDDLNPLHKKLSSEDSNYNFLDYFELNEELLKFLETVKDKFNLYIFTSGSIQNAKEISSQLEKIFIKTFSAEELGVSKKDPNAYSLVVQKIGVTPEEVLFIDDSQTNIEAASSADLNTFLYKDNLSLITTINSLTSF